MDKGLHDFLNGNSNVLCLSEAIITRDKTPTGSEYITIKIDNGNKELELYSFWHNPNKPVKKDKPPPKHTGGKKPYIMLMVDEIERLKKDGVSNVEELAGYLVSLGKYVEWNTGRLIHTRTKNQLKYKDIQKIFNCGNKKLNRLLADMKDHELLYLADGGYVISSRLIKKGKTNKAGGD